MSNPLETEMVQDDIQESHQVQNNPSFSVPDIKRAIIVNWLLNQTHQNEQAIEKKINDILDIIRQSGE